MYRVFLGLLTGVVILTSACTPRASVLPARRDVAIRRGSVDRFDVRVHLGQSPPTREPLDVLFLFDATMSMANVINTVRAQAREILVAIRAISTESRFGVATLADYPPNGTPWRLYQPFTHQEEAIASALDRIGMEDGGDLPEAYCRGLYEAQFLDWRPGARRFLILFGDAPAHDPEFYGKNLGVDPGRDGVVGTPDDLFLRPVVEQLAARQISILAIYDTSRWLSNKAMLGEALVGFEYMATRTGGLTKPIRAASEVAGAIRAGVRDAFRLSPAVQVPAEYREWVAASPAARQGSSHERFLIPVVLRPPGDVPDGIYRFPLQVVYAGEPDGVEIGRTLVTIRIGLRNWDWRRPALAAYALLLLVLLIVRALRDPQGAARYLWNGQAWVLLWRIALPILLLCGAYGIWRWAPGGLP